MRIALLNAVDYGSTGRIMLDLASAAKERGFDVVALSGGRIKTKNKSSLSIRFSTPIDYYFHSIFGYLLGMDGILSFFSTRKLIRFLKKYNPDLLHLHILHGTYVNYKVLFKYLEKKEIKVVWTFHDCWAFTGRCPHFQISKCNKWLNGCNKCLYPKSSYPQALTNLFNSSMWRKKKRIFNHIRFLTIVTPSNWLKSIVKQSFFSNKKVEVINNGIDLSVFHPIDSSLKESIGAKNKKIVLGVANMWSTSKGIEVFSKLSNLLGNDYQIVLIGTVSSNCSLPKEIIHIERTYDQLELAEYYSIADVFINPTYEDTFPTVNIEALACGTPVITFKTGGSPEIIDSDSGVIVEQGDCEALIREIKRVCIEKPFSESACRKRSLLFSKQEMTRKYIDLYTDLLKEND